MLTDEVEEVIARFIGMFDIRDAESRGRVVPDDNYAGRSVIEIADALPERAAGGKGEIGIPAYDPEIAYGNDIFLIERVRSQPLEFDGLPLELQLAQTFQFPFGGASPQPNGTGRSDATAGQADATISYFEAPPSSLMSRTLQINTMDDRDVLDLSADHDPLAIVQAVTRQFEAMVQLARSVSEVPEPFTEPASFEARLATSAHVDPASAGHGPEASTGHAGIYVNSEAAEAAPDLSAFFDEPDADVGEDFVDAGADLSASVDDPDAGVNGGTTGAASDGSPLPDELDADGDDETVQAVAEMLFDLYGSRAATLETGENLVLNEALLANIGHTAPVSVLMGDWHETNSIRQVNIYDDRSEITGSGDLSLSTGDATEAFNIASFERIDSTPGPAPAAATLPPFPSHYKVDVLEGDLFVTNVLHQVNMMMDGDMVALSSLRHDATLMTGDNQSITIFDFLRDAGAYDLVVIGGDVFEGNFIEQINVLLDSDRIHSDWSGADFSEGGLSTGGNLLVNDAGIVNYGALDGFTDLTPEMRELVGKFAAGETGGNADLGADLAFLQAQNLEVLYITGSVYEANVVSQMNVLNDSDSVLLGNDTVRDFVSSVGQDATWTIATGGNATVNTARIVDVDDVSAIRLADGDYYSDSMLLQAEIVAGEEDFATFDVDKLVSELVAFTTVETGPDDDDDMPYSGFHEAQTDGMAGMLA